MDITSCTKKFTRNSQHVNINDNFFPLITIHKQFKFSKKLQNKKRTKGIAFVRFPIITLFICGIYTKTIANGEPKLTEKIHFKKYVIFDFFLIHRILQ